MIAQTTKDSEDEPVLCLTVVWFELTSTIKGDVAHTTEPEINVRSEEIESTGLLRNVTANICVRIRLNQPRYW